LKHERGPYARQAGHDGEWLTAVLARAPVLLVVALVAVVIALGMMMNRLEDHSRQALRDFQSEEHKMEAANATR
jgi:hypothetical protein